jgi:hypothetical protein
MSVSQAAFSEVCPTLHADVGAVCALAAILDEDGRALEATAARIAAHCSRASVDADIAHMSSNLHAFLAPPTRHHTAAYAAAQNSRAVKWPAAPLAPPERRDAVGGGGGAGGAVGAGTGAGAGGVAGVGAGGGAGEGAIGAKAVLPRALGGGGLGAGATAALAEGLSSAKRPRFADGVSGFDD